MGKLDKPGYPLPDGELGDDEVACTIVYYPDRPEYRQALVSSLHYLGNWLAWERDEDKRGKDAAAAWKLANDLTLECLYMGCLTQLQNDVESIKILLENQVPCCGDTITYGPSTTYITIIVPGDGDAPGYYGETAVSDWDEWKQYLCHNANAWVDELVSNAQSVEIALSLGGLTLALIAYAFGAFNFLFMRGEINASTAMLRTVNMIAGYVIGLFSDAADDIETARDSIICAILSGRDASAAVETALSSGDAWDLFYQFIDYDSAMAVLYEGGDGDSEFLDAEIDGTCACLCLHLASKGPETNPVIYSSIAGAQTEMQRHVVGGQDDVIAGAFWANYDLVADEFCGPMKVIDSISVNDSINFERMTTFDQAGEVIDNWGPGEDPNNCEEAIGQLVGETFARLYLQRVPPSWPWGGGCGAGDITITMTYHDAD